MIPAGKLANLDQIATATQSVVAEGAAAGCRAVDLRVWDGIDLRILPDRGLDLGAAWFKGIPLAWISPQGELPAPNPDDLVGRHWIDVWPGGLVTTCGLTNVGEASDGVGIHGNYTARAATDVAVGRTAAGAEVAGVVLDPPFTLERSIRTSVGRGLLRIDDRVTNGSEWTTAAPMLYHVNIGAALWDGDAYLETDADEVMPRDADAAAAVETWDEPPEFGQDAPERVFEHVGATWARLTNPQRGVEVVVRSSFPRMWQWVHPGAGVYALGIEPANCSILGRAHDIAAGRMPFLDPGEVRESWLTVEARLIT